MSGTERPKILTCATCVDLADALLEVLEQAADREDIRDGSDGQPRPNDWMRVAQTIRAALDKAGVPYA